MTSPSRILRRFTILYSVAFVALALGLPASFFVAPTIGWWLALIGTLLGLIVVELLNTAIEKLSDHVTPEHSRAIKVVKDLGSAAVFVTLVLAFLVCVIPAFFLTPRGWTCIGINIALFALLRYCRYSDLVKKYSSGGMWAIAVTPWQWLLTFLAFAAIVLAVIGLFLLVPAT